MNKVYTIQEIYGGFEDSLTRVGQEWHDLFRAVAKRALAASYLADALHVSEAQAYDWLERQERLDFDRSG